MKALEKTFQVIDLLRSNSKGLSLSRIAGELGYPQSTVHRILQTLSAHDYIAQDQESKKYYLGFEFLRIGKSILENLSLREVAHEHLLKLHELCGETTHLYILRNYKLTVIDMIPKMNGLSLSSYIGWTTDPHPSAAGKVLLSGLTDQEIRELYADKPMKTYGKKTINNIEELLQVVAAARDNGYAIDDEEYYEGGRCVAAPIRAGSDGHIEAAISITGSVFSITMDRIQKELIDQVRRTAAEISQKLISW